MRAIGRLVAQPMLHVHASLGAFEDNMTVHCQRYDKDPPRPKLRMFT